MAKTEIKIKCMSPISLGMTKAYGGTLIESGLYITGGHLRGALGAIKQYASATEQQEIDQLLGTPDHLGIRFPNCYPSKGEQAYPLPLTAQSCKRAEGFIYDRKAREEKHGVADTLMMQLAYDRVMVEGEDWHIPLPFQYRCLQCGGRTEPYDRFAERLGEKAYVRPEISSHRQTRVAINRARLTAEESQLYSVQALDEDSIFVGTAELDDECANTFCKWIEGVERIGGRTSRGFGRVSVKTGPAPQAQSVRSRLSAFKDKYEEVEKSLRGLMDDPPASDGRLLFTVNLRSDALLRTPDGLPTLMLSEVMLRDALFELAGEQQRDGEMLDRLNLHFVAQYTQPLHVSGWQTAWKLPKEVLLASRMGGLYVFSANAGDPDAHDFLIEMLGRLEAGGIGEMREDGFGQITICDQFHLEVEPV